MSEKYQVSSSPHVRAKDSTSRVMLYVIIALLPATLFGIWNFGMHALLLILVTIASCLASEWIFDKIVHKKKQPAGSECGCHRTSSGTEPAGRTSMVGGCDWQCICHCHCKDDVWRTGTKLHEPGTGWKMFSADCLCRRHDKFQEF